MTVKIEDISQQLGISISTVSKALNGYSDVSPETRDRVLEIARDLGYHPRSAARNLRRQRTEKIGFIFSSNITYISDYFAEIIVGATTAAEDNGHNIVLYTNEDQLPERLLSLWQAREVDGLILVWDHVPLVIIDQLVGKLPFVILGRRVNHPQASYIAPDNYNGALGLMQHLFDLGHRRIGFMSRPSLKLTHADRFAAYKDALANADIPFDPTLVVETKFEPGSNYTAMTKLLDLAGPPTAVFAFHDLVAVDALQAILERGLRIPQDIALAGFDGLKTSLLTSPPITTVKQPLRDIGEQSVYALLRLIENNEQLPIQMTLPVQLDIRQSTIG